MVSTLATCVLLANFVLGQQFLGPPRGSFLTQNQQGSPPPVAQPPPVCPQRWIRKEIRELIVNGQLNAEGQAFMGAIACLMRSPGTMAQSLYQDFSRTHYDLSAGNHGYAPFLPWHRLFLLSIEVAMRQCTGNPNITIPYWDATLDSQDPANSIIFQFFGGDGNGQCIASGPYAGIQVDVPTGQNHCLNRNFQQDSPFQPPEVINLLTSAQQGQNDYDSFRTLLEGSIHAAVHTFVNGDMAVMYSSNDPLFYLHHSNIDRLWAQWQANHPQVAGTYSGPTVNGNGSPTDIMDMGYVTRFVGNRAVNQLYNINDYCYSYSMGALLPGAPPVQLAQGGRNAASGNTNSNNQQFSTNQRLNKREESISLSSLRLPIGVGSPLNKVTPDRSNKTDLFNIRKPAPIPQSYLEMNHMDVKKIREFEQVCEDFIDYMNSMENVVSPCALYYHSAPHSFRQYQSKNYEQYQAEQYRLDEVCKTVREAIHY